MVSSVGSFCIVKYQMGEIPVCQDINSDDYCEMCLMFVLVFCFHGTPCKATSDAYLLQHIQQTHSGFTSLGQFTHNISFNST